MKIFWRMWETEQIWGTIDFHSICFAIMEVNGAPKQPGYKLSSKYLPLCSAEKRLFIQVWNYLRVSKWWQNCHFWVNYTSKISFFFFSVFFLIIIVEQHSLNLNPWHFTLIKLEIKRIRKADEFLIPTLTVDLTVIMYWLTVLVLCWEISGVSAEALCAVWTRCLL